MFDVSTHIVQSHNETMEWVKNIQDGLDCYTYRPLDGLLAQRNAHLHQVMHYTSSTQEF